MDVSALLAPTARPAAAVTSVVPLKCFELAAVTLGAVEAAVTGAEAAEAEAGGEGGGGGAEGGERSAPPDHAARVTALRRRVRAERGGAMTVSVTVTLECEAVAAAVDPAAPAAAPLAAR